LQGILYQLALLVTVVYGIDIYVDPLGNDANSGCPAPGAAACLSIQAAVNALTSPTDIIHLAVRYNYMIRGKNSGNKLFLRRAPTRALKT